MTADGHLNSVIGNHAAVHELPNGTVTTVTGPIAADPTVRHLHTAGRSPAELANLITAMLPAVTVPA